MKVRRISVTAARTMPDPFRNYGNLRPEVHLLAEPEEGDDYRECVHELQAVAEGLLDDHLENLMVARTAIEHNDRMTVAQRRAMDMAELIRTDQKALKKERAPMLRKVRGEGL